MEINTFKIKRLNESLSKIEATFSHEISIMHKLCSLNDSVTHIVNNDFPLSSEKFITDKNSFDSKYLSQNYVSNLPEAVVILEKIPEALLHKYGYVNKNGKWYQLPTVKKITKPVVNKTSKTLRKYKYSSHNYNLKSVPWIDEKIEKAYKNFKKNYIEASYDIYPSIYLEKLDFRSYIKRISYPTDESCISASEENEQLIKESVSKTLDLTLSEKNIEFVSNQSDIYSQNNTLGKLSIDDKCLENNSNDESLRNCENSSLCKISQSGFPHILLEKLDLTSYSESISNTSSKKDVVKDSEIEVRKSESCEQNEQLNEESLSQTVDLSLTEKENEFLTYYSDPISSKDIDSQNNLQNLTDNLSMVYVDANGLENHSVGTSLLQIENIGRKETNCENSNCFKNAQNEFQCVLEKFISPETEMYSNLCINDSQPALCTNVAHDNVSDLPIQIESVCSISEQKFNKMEDQKEKPTRKAFSSRIYASDHSSSEDDIPLLTLLKRKLINAHVICDSSDSLNDDNDSYRNLANTNENLTVKKYRKKKKNRKSVRIAKLREKNKLLKKKRHNTFIEYVRMHNKFKKLRIKYKKIKNQHKNSANLNSEQLISQNSHDNVNDDL